MATPKTPASFEKAVADEYDTLLHVIAKGAADELGNRPETVDLTKDDTVQRWNYRNPAVTPDQLPTLAQTIAAEIVKKFEADQQPLPEKPQMTLLVAAQINRVLTSGYRRELVSRGFPRPEEQTKRAEQLAREAARHSDPMPVAPEPAMPALEQVVQEPAVSDQALPPLPSSPEPEQGPTGQLPASLAMMAPGAI